MLPLISVNHLGKTYGAKSVFEDLSLIINEREKIGLIGHNGSGKSTLLRILAGLEYHDDGEITHHKKIQISYMPQRPVFEPDDTPQIVVGKALQHRRERILAYEALCAQVAEAKDEKEIERLSHQQELLQTDIDAHGGWELQHDIEGMLRRLNLPQTLLHTPMHALSGGQQRRVALAKVLLERADVLLLDEPTANIDPGAEEQFYGLLDELRRRMTVLTVSHDLGFVNREVDSVICVNRRVVKHRAADFSAETADAVHHHHVGLIQHDHSCFCHCGDKHHV